ncbi:MAG: DUF421 domain-containing protein [Rhodothermales bacterium]|nr:DUF421 domain-containing protein [Rhodothermales bacterium]
MLLEDFSPLVRTLLAGLLVYVALIILLRISGKRTLSKWNAFDFIVTIALGSTMATAILSSTVSVVQGTLALALLIFLQYAVTWLSVRVRFVRDLVKAEPTLLVYRGQFLREAMRTERVAEDEVHAALRAHGFGAEADVDAVVLETDGNFSVVETLAEPPCASFLHVRGYREAAGLPREYDA